MANDGMKFLFASVGMHSPSSSVVPSDTSVPVLGLFPHVVPHGAKALALPPVSMNLGIKTLPASVDVVNLGRDYFVFGREKHVDG